MTWRETDTFPIPAEFWHRDDVRRALGSRDMGTLLRLVGRHSGASQTRIGAAIGIEQGHVSKVINGHRVIVAIDLLDRIATGLGMPDPCRILLGLAPRDPAALTAAGCGRTLAAGCERTLFQNAADAATAFGAWAESTNIGGTGLAQIHQATRTLASDYLTEPPVEVFRRAADLAGRVFGLIRGHQWPRQTRELYLAAGRLSVLLAWISGDVGFSGQAATHSQTAWLCADLAEDDDLRAWTLSVQSKTAFWDGRFQEAATLAARGRGFARVGTVPVLLSLQEADAWSELGARREARTALNRVSEARERADGRGDQVGGLLGCDLVRQWNYTGAVLLRLGDTKSALALAADALRTATSATSTTASPSAPGLAGFTGPPGYGTVSQIRIWAATAHIQSAEYDGALEVLRPVLGLSGGRRLETVAARLRAMDAALAARSDLSATPAVRELRAGINQY